MQSFDEFIEQGINDEYLECRYEQADELTEALITFGKRAYPRFGHIVIMAGGAASGKGFVKNKLLGIEGRSFDVDELKKAVSKAPLLVKRAQEEFGMDIKDIIKRLSENDGEFTAKLHFLVSDYLKVDSRVKSTLWTSVLLAPKEKKPNLIFDVTLKNLKKLQEISYHAEQAGYDKKNIHIVWVVNDIHVALKQNRDVNRGRVVPEEILMDTHKGASMTMKTILDMDHTLQKYMDGSIYFAFNKIGVDSEAVIRKDKSGKLEKGRFGGEKITINKANYLKMKDVGKPPTASSKLSNELKMKISSYTPELKDWM